MKGKYQWAAKIWKKINTIKFGSLINTISEYLSN